MVGARSDWVRLPPTRPCHPNTGTDPARRPDRDTTQGSHSQAEFMCRGAAVTFPQVVTHDIDFSSDSLVVRDHFRPRAVALTEPSGDVVLSRHLVRVGEDLFGGADLDELARLPLCGEVEECSLVADTCSLLHVVGDDHHGVL